MSLHIHTVGKELPEDFQALVDAARREGHCLLDRLLSDWASGQLRFDGPNEKLLMARIDGKLVGVGGITVEPTDASALRLRRFYVVPAARRQGVARALAHALLESVPDPSIVGVHVGVPSAFVFWEAVGFRRVEMAGISHRWAAAA
jgi:GNAT superfamily N-acetyltransferase